MGWPGQKSDPVAERERALAAEISALEKQIRQLEANPRPRFRSTARPHSETVTAPPPEPVGFEEVDQSRLKAQSQAEIPPAHFNQLGVRKYDLAGLLRRIKNHFAGPTATNPRLVNYLAAGGVQGLRAMRYERRIARNRFIGFAVLLLLVLIGLCAALKRMR
ncbi:MAG: hypothetical protein RLZZ350_202 [Verrucomicrobiota bacterium]|jgi:hypothetical protein